MAFFADNGFSLREMNKNHIGPVVFYEHMFYFKEAFLGTPITVSLEIIGLSEDGMFFKFEHNFYNDLGKNLANCEILGGWIDLNQRKLTSLPTDLLDKLNSLQKSDNFKQLTKEDTRKFNKRPIDL